MRTQTKLSALALALVLVLCTLVACRDTVDPVGLWETATYRSDETFGDGATTIYMVVEVEAQSVTFTIRTDKTNVADALMEHDLLSGTEGPYGLYIKTVNGMTLDPDKTNVYWALYVEEELSAYGASETLVSAETTYRLVYETF